MRDPVGAPVAAARNPDAYAGAARWRMLNLSGDVIPSRRCFAVSTLAAAVANATLLVVPGYRTALDARFLTGAFLAGAYPPSMNVWLRGSARAADSPSASSWVR
jgi:hypothetical protein